MLFLISILSFLQVYNNSRFEGIDPYQVLGLKLDFTERDLKRVYSRYISQRNKNPIPSERMQQNWEEIEYSYDILSNPSTKKIYDKNQPEFLNSSDFTVVGFQCDEQLMMMEKMMGGYPEIYKTFGGAISYPLEFSLLEFLKGATRRVTINTLEKCQCPDGTYDGNCDECADTSVDDEGEEKTTVIDVKLPAGAPNFYRIVVEDVFDTKSNRAPHDIIFIAMESTENTQNLDDNINNENNDEHQNDNNNNNNKNNNGGRKYWRDGHDILTTMDLPLSEKIRGGNIEIENVNGEKVAVNVDTDGMEAVAKGKGFPFLGNPSVRGNFKIKINVLYPKKQLTEEQRKIIDSILPDDPSEYE